MQTSLLNLDGRAIEYRFARADASSDLDIVMLHEGLGSTAMWRDFPDRLAAATHTRVLVYSRWGYGRSTPLSEPRSVDYMHEEARTWLPEILQRLEIVQPVLFGHSDGASIALIHAASRSSPARAVVALAPHVKVEALTIESIEKAKAAYGTLAKALARYHADVESAFWGWNRIWLDPAFRSWNIEALLPGIRCPVLAIQGRDDEYGTLEQITSIAGRVRGAKLLELADCRHSPHRDRPEAVIEATRALIEELRA
jgi:pimeloyl-ACP methyl ester carboxylesterase